MNRAKRREIKKQKDKAYEENHEFSPAATVEVVKGLNRLANYCIKHRIDPVTAKLICNLREAVRLAIDEKDNTGTVIFDNACNEFNKYRFPEE